MTTQEQVQLAKRLLDQRLASKGFNSFQDIIDVAGEVGLDVTWLSEVLRHIPSHWPVSHAGQFMTSLF